MRTRKAFFLLQGLLLFLCGLSDTAAAAQEELKAALNPGEELVTLPVRQGVTVRLFLISPATDSKGTFVLFPGGVGTLLRAGGRPGYGQFTSLFAKEGFGTAIVDVPSNYPYGYRSGGLDPFRASKDHAEDVRKIIEFVNQRWSKPIFLIGHSAGTVSVAHLGSVLKDQRIGGLVLLAAVGNSGRPSLVSLAHLPLGDITYPVLFVHHKQDDCTSFLDVGQQVYRLTKSPRVNFIEVLGGDPSRGAFCSPANPIRSYTHGLSGKEPEIVRAIIDWTTGKEVPNRIGP
jgi:hypothetical protein